MEGRPHFMIKGGTFFGGGTMFRLELRVVPCFGDLSILAHQLYLSNCNFFFTVFHQINGIHSPSDRQLDCLLSKFLLSQRKLP